MSSSGGIRPSRAEKKKPRPSPKEQRQKLLEKKGASRVPSVEDLREMIGAVSITRPDWEAMNDSTTFDVRREIASGEYGRVFEVVDKTCSLTYAAKVIDKDVKGYCLDTRIRPEYAIQMDLTPHLHIIPLREVFETESEIILLMEYCNGGSLHHYLQNQKHGRLDENEAKLYFAQMVEAVHWMHTHGYTHRDLKLENYLVHYNKRKKKATPLVLLGDFGCATSWKPGKKLHRTLGTRAYVSPEIINKHEVYEGPEADVWSLGVCLYRMTTGFLPFDGHTKQHTTQLIMKGHFSLQAHMSPTLQSLLRGMLQVDVGTRLNISHVLKHPWLSEAVEEMRERDAKDTHKGFTTENLGGKAKTPKLRTSVGFINRKLRGGRASNGASSSPEGSGAEHGEDSLSGKHTTSSGEAPTIKSPKWTRKAGSKIRMRKKSSNIRSPSKGREGKDVKMDKKEVVKDAEEDVPDDQREEDVPEDQREEDVPEDQKEEKNPTPHTKDECDLEETK